MENLIFKLKVLFMKKSQKKANAYRLYLNGWPIDKICERYRCKYEDFDFWQFAGNKYRKV